MEETGRGREEEEPTQVYPSFVQKSERRMASQLPTLALLPPAECTFTSPAHATDVPRTLARSYEGQRAEYADNIIPERPGNLLEDTRTP